MKEFGMERSKRKCAIYIGHIALRTCMRSVILQYNTCTCGKVPTRREENWDYLSKITLVANYKVFCIEYIFLATCDEALGTQ